MKKELIKAMHFHMFDLNVNVTTQTTEGQSLSVEMKTFYDKTLIRLAEAKLIHDQFGQKEIYRKTVVRLSSSGSSRHFRKH